MRKIFLNSIIFLSIIILILTYFSYVIYIDPNLIVDSDTIKSYSNSYLDEYMKIIEEHFGQKYGYYFNFYGKHPFNIKALISNQNGVAIEMIPNPNITENLFDLKFTNDKLENSIFKDNKLNEPRIEKIDEANSSIFYNNHTGAVYRLDHTQNFEISNVVFIFAKGYFIDFSNNSDLFLSDVIVDNIFYNHLYLNTCTQKKYWTNEYAKQRAYLHLKNVGISDSYIYAFQTEEFKEFFAYPDLENITKYIINRERNDPNYKQYEFENDIKNLKEYALNKYGVTNEYLNKVIDFFNYKLIITKNFFGLFEYDSNWVYSGLFLLLVLLGFIIAYIIDKKILPKIFYNEVSKSLPLSIFILSIINKPYGYKIEQMFIPLIPILIYLIYWFYKNHKKRKKNNNFNQDYFQ